MQFVTIPAQKQNRKKRSSKKIYNLAIVLFVILGIVLVYSPTTDAPKTLTQTPSMGSSAPSPTNVCSSNTLAQLLIVSVSMRRTWACSGSSVAMSAPVITGNENIASDLTPTGTYHIISKRADTHLIGCDTDNPTVCWNDFVNYDIIFLYNQYGHYDFHDATWRTANDFGSINPNSSNASHGCVETPLAAMAWLYHWTSVGTTVVVEA
ncbi:MAG TPA: L,D-transpeptidase [Candidatus Saccharimonadales bacterium]|nr:L,D-transpeptidase [Candidatus Saccharimonadales bacterium]